MKIEMLTPSGNKTYYFQNNGHFSMCGDVVEKWLGYLPEQFTLHLRRTSKGAYRKITLSRAEDPDTHLWHWYIPATKTKPSIEPSSLGRVFGCNESVITTGVNNIFKQSECPYRCHYEFWAKITVPFQTVATE